MKDHDQGRDRRAGTAGRNPFTGMLRRPYLTAFVIGSLLTSVVIFRKVMTEFEWVYVLSARNLLAGRGLYQLQVPPFRSFTYPPFMAALALPFTLLPPIVARASWFLVTLASVLVVWRGTWRLTGGGRLEGAQAPRREHLVAVLGLACALPYIESGVAHQQTDGLIAALLIVGCLSLTRSRDALAAVCFGVAAGMKCTPLLWAPYLAWRGRWKAAVLLPIVAVGVNLLPDLVHSPEGGGWWLGAWFDQFLRPMGSSDYLPGRWFAWILDNQSLSGTIGRWATTRCAWQGGGIEIAARAHPWSARTLRPLSRVVEGLFLAIAWVALWRGRRQDGTEPLREPLEFSAVLLLMLLLSPMSSRPHFATMLLPAVVLRAAGRRRGRRILFVPLLVTAFLAVLSLPYWGSSVGRLTMWCGVLTWGAVALLAGCLWALGLPVQLGPSMDRRRHKSRAIETTNQSASAA